MLTTYHELAVGILDTLEQRLVQSLTINTTTVTNTATTATATKQSLTAIIQQSGLTPAVLATRLPASSDLPPVWWRLYSKYHQVRELDALLLDMMAGGDGGGDGMDEVERRMRELGWEVPAADSGAGSGGSSGSSKNDVRGAAA